MDSQHVSKLRYKSTCRSIFQKHVFSTLLEPLKQHLKRHSQAIWDENLMFDIRVDY